VIVRIKSRLDGTTPGNVILQGWRNPLARRGVSVVPSSTVLLGVANKTVLISRGPGVQVPPPPPTSPAPFILANFSAPTHSTSTIRPSTLKRIRLDIVREGTSSWKEEDKLLNTLWPIEKPISLLKLFVLHFWQGSRWIPNRSRLMIGLS